MSTVLESQIRSAELEWLERWKQGPTRLRWERIPLQVGDPAPDFELPDSNGVPLRLSSFWSDKPALLIFWRHYGCSCGIRRTELLRAEYSDYVKQGANVVVVGQGEPERTTYYIKNHNLPGTFLCDPTYMAYQAYDLLEGKTSQILFDAADAFLHCDYKSGSNLQQSRLGTIKTLVDNPWQLPGEFVVDRKGIIRLAYRYQFCEDWPNPLVLVAAIKEAAWEDQ